MIIKTRFAPSPTGKLHIGSIRTALYAWLYAKQHNGLFFLRIEDTDYLRSKIDYIKHIIKYLKWLNINWQGPIYLQSKRICRYKTIVNELLHKGYAYKCFCSKERLLSLKQTQLLNKQKPKYDRYCFNQQLINNYNNCQTHNYKFVIRFNNPINGKILFRDLIRGKIVVDNKELDDFIICRNDGSFTYNFCCVVDDYDMQITHIIRGEEHLNNTPRQINLLQAIDPLANLPIYVHLPLILDHNKKKLSKRIHNFTNMSFYKHHGYLPNSILNYLLRLGWAYKDQEFFTQQEMLKLFNLPKVHKSPCIFDLKKLDWYNKVYLKNTKSSILIKLLKDFLDSHQLTYYTHLNFSKVVNLLKNRCSTLLTMYTEHSYLFNDLQFILNPNILVNHINYLHIYQEIYNELIVLQIFSIKNLTLIINKIAKLKNFCIKQIFTFLQLAITGNLSSPSIYEIIIILEKKITLIRISNFLKLLENNKKNNNITEKQY